ncbi:TPA: methyltransferase [Candidatus Woesearchaeota archaeon]|nr:50S ribosomal protein L11 methyltransferase [Candidatus Woesearchaeota archaeon]HIH39882.1 methyltransferase [Candidatus Woesearchaeota archaeon]
METLLDNSFNISEMAVKRVKVAPEHKNRVFKNNTVSKAIAEGVIRYIQQNPGKIKSILGLGCGNGVMEIAYSLFGVPFVAGTDIDSTSIMHAIANAEVNGVEGRTDFRTGDMYHPFKGRRFNMGVHDASSVAHPVAKLTDWYPGEKNSGGELGTETSEKALDSLDELLEKDGVFFFPRVTLAAHDEIAVMARRKYESRVVDIVDKYFPKRIMFANCLCDPECEWVKNSKADKRGGKMIPHPVLAELKNKGIIYYEQVGDILVWYLHAQLITAKS